VSDQSPLFALPEPREALEVKPATPEQARVVRPQRDQLRWEARSLDAALPEGHPARAVWDLIVRLDLRQFYASIKSVTEGPGRPATDPRVLLALWVYACTQDVGSARQLARLCEEHDAYRWLRGDVPVNYHMLSDFRSCRVRELDELMTKLVAMLKAAGAVTLQRVAQDGLRTRGWAGKGSTRGEAWLEECLEQARAEVSRLARLREQPDPQLSARQRSARERAARERLERVERALTYLPQIEARKDRQRQRKGRAGAKLGPASVSITDPEARVMHMPDGGYRAGYNLQLATDAEHGIIVGVSVSQSSSDGGLALPMYQQVAQRTGALPATYLMDGGYVSRTDITAMTRIGSTVLAPLRSSRRSPTGLSDQPRYDDTPEVRAWRQRMTTPEAKTAYVVRAATAEWTNAQLRQHGLGRLTLRGLARVTSALLLACISHNLMRWLRLGT
jgi:transposase